MSEIVTLELPDELVTRAREIALRTDRRFEDLLVEWLGHAAAELPVESLPDDQILTLCELELNAEQAEELSDLLADNREGVLGAQESERLDALMQLYRQRLVRKAQAFRVAVQRGLIAPLN